MDTLLLQNRYDGWEQRTKSSKRRIIKGCQKEPDGHQPDKFPRDPHNFGVDSWHSHRLQNVSSGECNLCKVSKILYIACLLSVFG